MAPYHKESMRILNKDVHTCFPHSRDKFSQANTLSNGVTYYYNGDLLCKSYAEDERGQHPFFLNHLYRIRGMEYDKFTLQEDGGPRTWSVPVHSIMEHFSLPYLNTGHSSQGSAIEGSFVVADLRSPYIDRNWLHTAVTHLKYFKDLYLLDVDLRPSRPVCLNRASYLLRGYKQQDRKAGRQAPDEEY